MDEIGKAIEQHFELGLSIEQSNQIDSIFQAFMRAIHFPISDTGTESLLKFNYFRKALNVLTSQQLKKYKTKKLAAKVKSKIRENEQKERQIKYLENEYKDVQLTAAQIEKIYKTKNEFKKRLIDLEEQHAEILRTIENTINDEQIEQLEKLFSHQLRLRSIRKVESIKNQYSYLSLTDDQAEAISILNEKEKKQRIQNDYKFNDPYLIKQELKHILTGQQFEIYSLNQEQLKERSLQSQIQADLDKSDEFTEIEELINFQIENILPVKCRIAKELIESASEEDLHRIEELKSAYNNQIAESVIKQTEAHAQKYGSQLPNSLKLSILETTLSYTNPSSSLLGDLDLNFNIFSGIQLNDIQKSDLETLKLKQREYNIERLERKLKGSYAPLATIRREREIPEFFELYSILMLESEPKANIEKMKSQLDREQPN
ncbi:hypothetical protein [Portibacter lacus]|uniref:Uncharacterized protein n=1 Tax=Portibacter lacus TaxID=1099794 RepID=A0AA37SSY7_9BACT|nr:hypothetical protein [Portibacter lacus]GLR19547.1 hypothetical protein GCM10007940_41630 [Portibacter lacus]